MVSSDMYFSFLMRKSFQYLIIAYRNNHFAAVASDQPSLEVREIFFSKVQHGFSEENY
jgi:hypothetical protein